MRAEHRDRIGKDVRQHESDAIALLDALRAQPGREGDGVTLDFREGQALAEALIGGALGEAAHALVEEIDERAEA